MIRCVRKVLDALLKDTMMCEVEAILNRRLLKKVSDYPNDLQSFHQSTYSFCTLDRCAFLESLKGMISLARSVGGRSSSSRICSGSGGPKSILFLLQKHMQYSGPSFDEMLTLETWF